MEEFKDENTQVDIAQPVDEESIAETVTVNEITTTNKKKKYILAGVIAVVVVVAVIIVAVLVFGKNEIGTKNFSDMYSDIANESWCRVASDGSYITIDTNPYDVDDYSDITAYYKLETINRDLGFSSALFEEMGRTRALDGRQSESNDKYEVSWSYHPDTGLEVIYKLK